MVQERVVDEILSQGRNWSRTDLAFALSVAYVESGFNPDTASASSSASGVGQFIDRTGESFGLNEQNRFEYRSGIYAFLRYLGESLQTARESVSGWKAEYRRAYALYHDGPKLESGGEQIANRRILPLLAKMESFLRCRGV